VSANPTIGRPPAFVVSQEQGTEEFRAALRKRLVNPAGKKLIRRFTVYSANTIRQRLKTFDRAFRKVPHTVCYSVKANSNLSILRLLAKLGCGFDVVSGGELERVLHADRRAARKVVFSGVRQNCRRDASCTQSKHSAL